MILGCTNIWISEQTTRNKHINNTYNTNSHTKSSTKIDKIPDTKPHRPQEPKRKLTQV